MSGMQRKKCIVEGCNHDYAAKGLCKKHYQQKMRHGRLTPERELPERVYKPVCTVEGCNNKHHAKGFCKKHYLRECRRNKKKNNE